MTFNCFLLLSCAMICLLNLVAGLQNEERNDLCYKISIKGTDGEYSVFNQVVHPITKFPTPHAYVQATNEGKGICGMNYKAGDPIPGTKNAMQKVTDGEWSSMTDADKQKVPRWSGEGKQDPNACPGVTYCLNKNNKFKKCNAAGFISSGVAWYAYNFPNASSSNTGYEQTETAIFYFVASEDGEGFLVLVHDKPHDGTGGAVRWEIKASAGAEVFLNLRDDNKPLSNDCSTQNMDCYSWKWDKKKGTGSGNFYQSWSDCCTDGLVMGPLPVERFTLDLRYLEWFQINNFKIGTLVEDDSGNDGEAKPPTVAFNNISLDILNKGFRVEGFTCNDYCPSFTDCSSCTANKDCGWCSSGKCQRALQTSTLSNKQQCEDSGNTWTEPETCCSGCSEHKSCGSCVADSACGWCLTDKKCMPGTEEGPCSFGNLQCTALEDVAPYESKSAFVFHHCPCKYTDHRPGYTFGGNCQDLVSDETVCATASSSSAPLKVRSQTTTAGEACCRFGGGNLRHKDGCIKWTDDNLKAKCATNFKVYPDSDSAEDCLNKCATFDGCKLWTFSDEFECVICMSSNIAKQIKLSHVTKKYQAGTNTCSKGCHPGMELKYGKTCHTKCDDGYIPTTSTREFLCGANGVLTSTGISCTGKSCQVDSLITSDAFINKYPFFISGTCPVNNPLQNGESCKLECAKGRILQDPSTPFTMRCNLGQLEYDTETLFNCRAASCTIDSSYFDSKGLKGVAHLGMPACSPSLVLDGESGLCAVACQRGFQSDGSAIGAFTCDLGTLKDPAPGELPDYTQKKLECDRIRCETTGLQTGGDFNSIRTDQFQGVKILEFEQKVSFACKEGYEIKDKESFIPSDDDQICDRYWQSNYEPDHNTYCKAITCKTDSILLEPGQIVVDELDQPIDGAKTVPYKGVVKVKCNTPSYYVVDGNPSETFTCSQFSSFKKGSSVRCERVQCNIAHIKLHFESQAIISSQTSAIVSYMDKVVVGCATGYFNTQTSTTITCETINSFKAFDMAQFPCTPISCSVETLKLSLPPYIKVQTDGPNVAFDRTAKISCHQSDNVFYFSSLGENYQVEYKCETPTSFKGKTGSELECEKCTKVDGCNVAETCTTASNSKCADCSGLISDKGAYRSVSSTDTATVCTKCGGLSCEDNTEEKLRVGSKACDGTGDRDPYTCVDCELIENCKTPDPKNCDKCNQCEAGFYNDGSTPNKCLPCLKKTENAAIGAKFLQHCITGHCTSTLDVECNNCEEDFYIKDNGSCERCVSCKPGEKLVNMCTGKAKARMDMVCEKCPAKSYSDVPNSPKCSPCPDISITKHSELANSIQSCICEAGFGISGMKCTECSADTFMSTSSTVMTDKSCNKCPEHSTTNQQSRIDDVASCICKPGYAFSKTDGSNLHKCEPCLQHTYKTSLSNSDQCKDCPLHTVTDNSTAPFISVKDCKCKPGYGALGSGQPCSECKKNYYKSSTESKPCTACPDKSTTASSGSTKLTDCKCLKGYARVNDKCVACPTGKYADTRDQTECTACPLGSTTLRYDQMTTIWEPIDTATNLTNCTCNQGYKKVTTDTGHKCVACPIGYYAAKENSERCRKCPVFTTTRQNASTTWEDCLCNPGYTGRITTPSSKCSLCLPGFFKDRPGREECQFCEQNTATKRPHFTSEYCLCNPGYYLNGDSSSATKCRACPVDTYKDSQEDTISCSPCPAHTSTTGAVAVTSAKECTCDPGYYYANYAGACVECPVDTFKDHSGDGKCQKCSEGRPHSSSKGVTKLVSVNGCLCDVGYFLYNSKFCRKCADVIEHCLECETDPNSINKAICTKAPVGHSISLLGDSVSPNKCNGPFKFGDDILPDEVDISHCLQDAIVEAFTGSLCQPLCKTNYRTTKPLPVWKTFSTGYCGTDAQKENIKIESKDEMPRANCRKYCELLPDCYFFVEYVGTGNRTSCSIWRANTRCSRLDGFRSGDQDEKNLLQTWHAYDGISDDGFQLVCDKNGVWNAEKLSDKKSAIEFFERQCEQVTTTTTTTTTTSPAIVGLVAETPSPSMDMVPIIAGSAGGFVFLILVITIIAVVVCRSRNSNMEHEKPSVMSDEEINEVFKKTDDEEDGYVKSWMDGDKPATFDDDDNLPT